MKTTKTNIITKQIIADEWMDEDGYWMILKDGWKSASDPVGALHTIHEDNRRECLSVGALPCACPDCVHSK